MKTQYSEQTEHNGIKMSLIGFWMDLAAYYSGSDGNAWCFSSCTHGWTNEGPLKPFIETFSKRRRGVCFHTVSVSDYLQGTKSAQ